MKTADCEKLATHFFLNQQGWSSYILPISILAGVFAYARLARKALNMKSWTIIVVVVLVTYAVLTLLSRMIIPQAAFRDFVDHCHRCQMDPYCGGPRELTVEDVLSYTGRKENFEDEEGAEGVDEENTIDNEQQPEAADPSVQTNATPENDIAEEEAPVDNASANEIETYTDYAPFDASFPNGTFRQMGEPMQTEVVNDNSVPQPLTPGEFEQAQALSNGPTIYNAQWASYVAGNKDHPQGGFEPAPANSMCMSFKCPCEAKCSGDAAQNAQCGQFVAPVPGPTWQPQRAAVVQARLAAGDYVPATCPLA